MLLLTTITKEALEVQHNWEIILKLLLKKNLGSAFRSLDTAFCPQLKMCTCLGSKHVIDVQLGQYLSLFCI